MAAKKSRLGLWGFVIWTVWVFFYAGVMDWQVQDINYTIALISSANFNYLFAGLSIGVWYLCRRLPFEMIYPLLFGIIHFILAIFVSALWLVLSYGIWYLSEGAEALKHIDVRSIIGWQFLFGMIQYFLVAGIFYTITYYRNYRQKQLAEAELKALTRDAELKALKLQMNPHFLFNTLNSISALVTEDPVLTRKMITRLSELLRMSLEHHEEQVVPLATELSFARTYISIEQIRFGDRMKFKEDIDDGLATAQVPAMLLQPLLENAVKHSIANSIAGGELTLSIEKEPDGLICRITNPKPPDNSAENAVSTGTGLKNIRQRLDRLYGNRYQIQIGENDNHLYEVTIKLPDSV